MPGGRLKKRGLDRDSIAVERALQGITAVESTLGGLSSSVGAIQSFDYDVFDVDATVAGVTDTDVPFAATNAVIAGCVNPHNIRDWSVNAGTLSVTTADAGSTIRFLVF